MATIIKSTRKFYGNGLYLQTSANGKASWLYRYQYKGAAHWMGVGSKAKGVTLAKARQRAHDAADDLYRGDDPIQTRRDQRAQKALDSSRQITFADAATQYYAKHEVSWSQKHREAFLGTLKQHAFPELGNMSVAAIDTAAVLRVVEPIWLLKHQTASRVLNRIELILDWAAAPARKYRTGLNPAKWELLKDDLPSGGDIGKVVNHPALPYNEVPGFVAQLLQRQGIGPKALAFIIMTAARTSEVTKAEWSEFDLEKKIWTVPLERMKGRRPHRVPLTSRMLELLPPREAGNDLVFIGSKAGRPLGKMALPNLVDAMKYTVTIHGFRASFKTWATDQTSYPDSMIEYPQHVTTNTYTDEHGVSHVVGGDVTTVVGAAERNPDAHRRYTAKVIRRHTELKKCLRRSHNSHK